MKEYIDAYNNKDFEKLKQMIIDSKVDNYLDAIIELIMKEANERKNNYGSMDY